MGNQSVRVGKQLIPLKVAGPISAKTIEKLLTMGFLPILTAKVAR